MNNKENRLVIIGIDEYVNASHKKLDNAVLDVKRFEKVLSERYNFCLEQSITNSEATRANIIDKLDDLKEYIAPSDNLIIYYAGHGNQDPITKQGYWIPTEANDRISSFIPNQTILDTIKKIDAKHILLISDSCFSGSLITNSRSISTSKTNQELDKLKSRWIFTSGGEETVKDGISGKGSPFSNCVNEYLEKNKSIEFSAKEFFDEVIQALQGKISYHPRAEEFVECPGHEGGQMIFRLASDELRKEVKIQKEYFPSPILPILEYYIPRTVTVYENQEQFPVFIQPKKGSQYLEDVLQDVKRVVLLGAAGSGKSVELNNVFLRMRSLESLFIPVYKRFNTYVQEDIEEYLPKGWADVNPDRIVVFLDGLDEIPPQFFKIALRKIIAFTEEHSKVRIVISCRTNFYELPYDSFTGTLDGFIPYRLNDISIEEIKNYVTKNFQINGEDFIKEIFNRSLNDLVQKPFFLNILIKNYKEMGNLSAKRSEIIEYALVTQFSNNHQHFKTTTDYSLNQTQIFFILERIAFVMEMMGKNFITDAELRLVFPDMKEYELIKYMPAFNHNVDDGKWQFDHNNIQEYLASRILMRRNFENLLEIITLKDSKKIKPYWANTLSFLISIGSDQIAKPIIDWLLENDREFILKFEPERIPKQIRVKLFTNVFNYYSEKGIWIISNKFTVTDLARIGAYTEIIDFLLSILNNQKASRISKLNAVQVLDDFDHTLVVSKKGEIFTALERLLETENDDYYFIYSLLLAFGRLGLINGGNIEPIVNRFKKRKNQYIRAGLYKLIYLIGEADKYIDVFLDGLDINSIEDAIDDREETNLMDENFHLEEGLKTVKSYEGIMKLLSFFKKENFRNSLYYNDYLEAFESLITNATLVYSNFPDIYDCVLDFFIFLGDIHEKKFTLKLIPFFTRTNTTWKTFMIILKDEKLKPYSKDVLLGSLLNDEILNNILSHLNVSGFSEAEIMVLDKTFKWNMGEEYLKGELIQDFKNVVKQKMNISLPNQEIPDWKEINKKKTQKSFDLLFDIDSYTKEIKKVFDEINSETINQQQFFEIRRGDYQEVEEHYISSALELIKDFTYGGNNIEKKTILEWIRGKEFYKYLGTEIYEYLKGNHGEEILISDFQRKFIQEWVHKLSSELNIEELALRGDRIIMVLWFFIQKFNVQIEDDKLLGFTYYYNFNDQVELIDSGTIDEIEKFISTDLIKTKVISNLKKRIPNSLAWLNNASYAIRNGITEADQHIQVYLENADDKEYKLGELLELLFIKQNNIQTLKEIAGRCRSQMLRQKAITLLVKCENTNEFLIPFLQNIIKQESELDEIKLFVSNQLILLNDMVGLEFSYRYIVEHPQPNMDYYHRFSNIIHLKVIEAIPILLELLLLSQKTPFKEDRFSFLESRILEGIFNIGIQSAENFKYVKAAIENLIKTNSRESENLDYLNSNIMRMEEQLIIQQSKGANITESLREFANLS